MSDAAGFVYADDPDEPGWKNWALSDPTRFNGLLAPFKVRPEPDGTARVRMFLRHEQSNLRDAVHGGTTLALIDIALRAAARSFGLIVQGDDTIASFAATIRKPDTQ